jgi:DNA-binding response OmpR family regulator
LQSRPRVVSSSFVEGGARTILIAEDEPSLQGVLTAFFERNGFRVVAASDGVEACEAAEAERPDLAILDLMLPRRDGYAVLLHLRSREATRALPVIILSAEPPERHETIARSLGAQGFLSKPFPLEKLLEIVRAILK